MISDLREDSTMLLLEKKSKCPLCGAKNPVGAPRCTTCTRPLENDPLPSQAVYQEALWSTKIASKASRKKSNPYAILGMLVVIAVIANYFLIGWGPSWAHEPKPVPKGSSWKEYHHGSDYVVDLPGSPAEGTASALGVTLDIRSVWVNGQWDVVRDGETRSVGAIQESLATVHAGVFVGLGPAPADTAASLSALVSALAPGVVLEAGGVTTMQDPPSGEQRFTLETPFTGFPEAADSGTARARAIVLDGRIFLTATLVVDGGDAALQANLDEHFVPAGASAG